MSKRVMSMVLLMSLAGGALAADRPAAMILAPKQKQKVERVTELTGKVLVRGWPVVLVRPEQADDTWWGQQAVEASAPGHFKTKAIFGNDRTKAGSKFHVVVLMLQSAEEAEEFTPGMEVKQLPEGTPRSAETIVIREVEASEGLTVSEQVISSLRNGGAVRRMEAVSGKLASEDVRPVLLVRSDEPNDSW